MLSINSPSCVLNLAHTVSATTDPRRSPLGGAPMLAILATKGTVDDDINSSCKSAHAEQQEERSSYKHVFGVLAMFTPAVRGWQACPNHGFAGFI